MGCSDAIHGWMTGRMDGKLHDVLDHVWLAVFGKEDENVCMRQPTLLKFNDIDSRNHASQNMLLVNVVDQLLQFDFEHSGYQIRSIMRLLYE
jgi:hypothetical protein